MGVPLRKPDVDYEDWNEASSKSYRPFLTGLSCVMAGIAIGIAMFAYYKQPKIVAFDLKATSESFLQQLQKSSLSEEGKLRTVRRFESALNEVVAEYAENNTVVLVKAAVVSSVPDKTAEIKKKVSQRMKQVEQ